MRTMYFVVLFVVGSEGVGETGGGSIGVQAFRGRASTSTPCGKKRDRERSQSLSCNYFSYWVKTTNPAEGIHYRESIFWQRKAKESRQIFEQHGGHVTVMLHGLEKRPLANAV